MGGTNGDIAAASESAPASKSAEDGSETTDLRLSSEAETSGRGGELRKGKQALPEGEAELGLEAPLLRTDIEAGGGGQEGTEGEIPVGLRSLSKGSARSSNDSVDECRICKEEREPGEKMIRWGHALCSRIQGEIVVPLRPCMKIRSGSVGVLKNGSKMHFPSLNTKAVDMKCIPLILRAPKNLSTDMLESSMQKIVQKRFAGHTSCRDARSFACTSLGPMSLQPGLTFWNSTAPA